MATAGSAALDPYHGTDPTSGKRVEDMRAFTIGTAARQAGVNVETIRFYERCGLIERPPKGEGYRQYTPELVARVRFIRQAQGIGFSLREIEELLALEAGPDADCGEVRARARAKVEEVDRKIAELGRVRAALEAVIAGCPGEGGLHGCSILNALKDAARSESRGDSRSHRQTMEAVDEERDVQGRGIALRRVRPDGAVARQRRAGRARGDGVVQGR